MEDVNGCGGKGSWVMAVRSTQPHFGNMDTKFNMRERKRLSKDTFNGHI